MGKLIIKLILLIPVLVLTLIPEWYGYFFGGMFFGFIIFCSCPQHIINFMETTEEYIEKIIENRKVKND